MLHDELENLNKHNSMIHVYNVVCFLQIKYPITAQYD